MNWILAGLAFGFLGSIHCVGMCGPIALSLPQSEGSELRFVIERVLYNLGRVITYVGLGALIGTLGRGLALAGAQKILSVGIGTVMILAAVVPWVARQLRHLELAPSALLERVTRPMHRLYQSGGLSGMVVIGLLNGLLPCGFVYAALATALTAGSIGHSVRFMAAFGFGTIPAMIVVSLLGRLARSTFRRRLHRLVPVGLAIVGVLLIIRGLELGVMFSPLLPSPDTLQIVLAGTP